MRPRTALAGLLLSALGLGLLAACAANPAPAPPRKDRFPYRRLRPSVAYEMMRDTPDLLILDLRPPEEFNGPTGHLRRAQNIPLAELRLRVSELVAFHDDTFLVYCREPACVEQGLAVLRANGFEGAVLLEGGIDAWISNGFLTVLPPGALGRPGRGPRPQVDAGGVLRPLRPGEKPAQPPEDVPQGPPPPR